MLRNELARLWSNWRYRWIPARISDRVDNQDMLNLRTHRNTVKWLTEVDDRLVALEKVVKRLEMLEKHNAKS